MSEEFSNADDFEFIPPLPDEDDDDDFPPLPPPSPPPLPPNLTDEEPPPLPLESPPSSPRPPSPVLYKYVSDQPPLPDFSPPSSPRSPSPPPPVLIQERPFSHSALLSSRRFNSPLTINTNIELEVPVVSPQSSFSYHSELSSDSKPHSYLEPTSPWQLAASDTHSIMSDNESIEDGEIVSLPDLDAEREKEMHNVEDPPFPDDGDPPFPDDGDPPPLPSSPHPHDERPPVPVMPTCPVRHHPPPPLPEEMENDNDDEEEDEGLPDDADQEAGELTDSEGEKEDDKDAQLPIRLSPKPGMKRTPEDTLGLSQDAKKQRLDDECSEAMDDAASSIADPAPSIVSSVQEFQILDDAQWDADDDQEEEDGNDTDSSLDYEEIDAMLDSGVADPKPREPIPEGEEPVIKDKVILIEKGTNPFEVLPEGWITVTHNSGMPVYLHKETRVCTLTKPYFLGPGSIRKHDIPVSSIPCLQYRKEVEKEKEREKNEPAVDPNSDEKENQEVPVEETIERITSQVRIESAAEKSQETSLSPDTVREYCENLFQFKTITVHRFKTWKDRRRHQHKQRKISRPMLPSDTKLITCPILARDNESEEKPNRKKGFVLNPAGKSAIGILHEYMQHSMRLQPQYQFKELDNASTPYSATVLINKMAYGIGYATSKKAAKVEAAKATLDILIPQLKNSRADEDADPLSVTAKDLSFFDELKIEDPRVADLCNRAGQPSPYQILLECLKRNFVGDASLQMDMKTLKRQTGQFTMSVGSHSTTVNCKNKREGKQLAAQSILQLLHPHITCWGSLLRLYGTDSHRALKQFQESITKLQSKERSNGPNLAVLAKLKKEMLRLRERKAALVPIGTMKIRSAELPSPTPVSIIKL